MEFLRFYVVRKMGLCGTTLACTGQRDESFKRTRPKHLMESTQDRLTSIGEVIGDEANQL